MRARWLLLSMTLGCATRTAPMPVAPAPDPAAEAAARDAAYLASIEAWHTERIAALRAEDGWLSLIGLHWLSDGTHTLGSGADRDVQLAAPRLPADLGQISRQGPVLTLSAAPESQLTVNQEPLDGERSLATDASSSPDVVEVDGVKFYGIERGERIGLRVKDTRSPALEAFTGVERFEVDPGWRVRATLEPHPDPVELAVPNVLGDESMMPTPGRLHFELDGRSLTLDPVGEPGDPELFLVYGDATNGLSTYGGGRFLSAMIEEDGRTVWLDFNKSLNPPCAFTNFATCPLPPEANTLDIEVLAGERDASHH